MSENEIKNETPVEETEEVKASAPKSVDDPVELTKYTSDERSYVEVVDELRLDIVKQTKKQQRISTISMVVVLLLCVGGFLFLGNKEYQFISYILLGVALVTLLTFSVIVKRIASPDVKTYVAKAYTAVNRYVFNDGQYTDCTYYPTSKIVYSEVCEDGVYKDVKETVSRDVVEGKFNGRSFKAGELGIYKAMVKRAKPTAFVGKYLTYPNDLHFVDRIVIVSRGATDIDIPDGLEDLAKVQEDEKFEIYAKEGTNVKEILGSKFISAIKNFEVANHLLTLTVVIWAGRSVVYASYDDESVTLPFMKKIDETCFTQYRDDTLKVIEALHMLVEE